MQEVDTLIHAKWVIPVEPAGAVLESHSVAVSEGTIVAVRPSAEARLAYRAKRSFDLERHALIPGLVNVHTHAAMTLMRGLADDRPLMRWLQDAIWPAEASHVSEAFVRDGAALACAEMFRGGITCFNDMYFFPEACAEAAIEAGIRATIGLICLEFPTRYASDADAYLTRGLSTRDAFRDQPLVSFAMAPHAPYSVSDATFGRVVTLAEELDLPIHLHLHETADEIEAGVAAHGMRPLARLESLGVLGPRLVAAHAIHLEPTEIAALARNGASVVHCPSSNLKLASGFAPVERLLAAGVNVALGTDGAASNNRLDLFSEMRSAALLAKAVSGRADAMPAAAALAAATLNGARALGLEARIGTITPGKAADLCAVDFSAQEMLPCYDPISHLVYVAGREQVSHVWVDGRVRVDDKNLAQALHSDLDKRIALWQNKLASETKT